MMEHPLNIDGPLMGFLNKTGQLIALSVLWLLSCLPVVTIPAATTALYYAVCKTVRHDRGSAVQEYRRSFRVNLLRGMGAGLPPALLTAVLMLNLGILSAAEGSILLTASPTVQSVCSFIKKHRPSISSDRESLLSHTDIIGL